MIETFGVPTPLGGLRVTVEDDVVIETRFVEQVNPSPHPLRGRIEAYFGGELDALDAIPVRHTGTAFQLKVWRALREIPTGETITYADLAVAAGSSGATRAAGSACGTNKIGVIVPCHRVVRTGGGLGGYAGGLDKKRWLLAHERPAAATLLDAEQIALPV